MRQLNVRCLNMADQTQRDEVNEQRPSTSGSALSFKTGGGTELTTNDPWTARIMVTALSGVGIYLAKSLVSFLSENPEVVKSAIQLALQAWGAEVSSVRPGSIIVDLGFESKENFLKFKEDLENGKVKDAMEKEFKEKGFNAELKLKLLEETSEVAIIEISKESVMRETKKITFVNPKPEVESHGEREAEIESDKKTDKQEEEGGPDPKKPKLDLEIAEPGIPGVSSTSKTKKAFKEGIVSNSDLKTLGKAIGRKWDRLARQLPKIVEDEIEEIEDAYRTLSERGHHILKLWKGKNGDAADYKTLYDALDNEMVQRKDLAEQYCLE